MADTGTDLSRQLQAALGDDCRVGRELAATGLWQSFEVEDLRLGRELIARIILPNAAPRISSSQFLRELRPAALLHGDGIDPLLTCGEAAGFPYFTMPRAAGESLRHRLAGGPRPRIDECVSTLRDVTVVVRDAHAGSVLHLDLTPEHVIFSRRTVVTDFGVARAATAARLPSDGETLSGWWKRVGTQAYLSPEQAAGEEQIDHRADIYAIGVLAYEMLAGQPPVVAATDGTAAPAGMPVPLIRSRSDIPEGFYEMIMKCLQPNPCDRYRSADDLLTAILDATRSRGPFPHLTGA